MSDMTEAELMTAVVDLARMLGYRTMHVRRSIGKGRRWQTTTSVVGWPDLVLWTPGRFIAAELKSATGALAAEQVDVLASLHDAGVETYVWRPDDLQTIATILRRKAAA